MTDLQPPRQFIWTYVAILISDSTNAAYDGNLSTANGFYRVEASNMGGFSTTSLSLSSTRTIAMTFANAGNCQGAVICLYDAGANTIASYKAVTVKLQENVATVWTDRASKTLTAAEISNSSTSYQYQTSWNVAFVFTAAYAVTTAGSTWRLEITNATGTNNWSIRTSDATNPMYACWCDNQVTFANNDTLIVKDTATINQTCTFRGTLGTGDVTRSVAVLLCTSLTNTDGDNVCKLKWAAAPAASYTMTLDGLMVFCAHAGFRIGTSAARIPYAQQAIVKYQATPTNGTATGFHCYTTTQTANDYKMSLFMYGEVPATPLGRLNADAATGQANIVTTTSTGWANGNRLYIGKADVQGSASTSYSVTNTISSIAGANITMTSNLAGNTRKAGGPVILLDGYGVKIQSGTASTVVTMGTLREPGNLVLDGVEMLDTSPPALVNSAQVLADSGNDTYGVQYKNIVCYYTTFSQNTIFGTTSIHAQDMVIDKFYLIGRGFSGTMTQAALGWSGFGTSGGNLTMTNCLSFHISSGSTLLTLGGVDYTFQDNEFYNSGGNTVQPVVAYNCANSTIDRNVYYGTAGAMLKLMNFAYPISWSGDTFNRTAVGLYQEGAAASAGAILINGKFGNEQANTTNDFQFRDGGLVDIEFQSPTGAVSVGTTSTQPVATAGSLLRISDYNDTTNDDRGWLPNGYYQRTGYGLTDTNVFTSGLTFGAAGAGQFALRLEPNSSTKALNWPNRINERAFPTGNILGQTMTITCKIKINSATYYAGTHQKPRLNVKYDNTTTTYAEATGTTSGQMLSVTFTPTTSYGQIEIWISGYTDATGSSAYFYIDDVFPLLPAGVQLNSGTLDNWAHATPIPLAPATVYPAGSDWDRQTSAHTSSGSFGEQATQTNVETKNFLTLD